MSVNDLADFAEFDRVLVLETTDDSALGAITRVMMDPGSPDEILVSDEESTNAAYRFDSRGRLLAKYQGSGSPGEPLLGAVPAWNSSVVLLHQDKLLRFSRDGRLRESTPLDYIPRDAVFVDDRLYVLASTPPESSASHSILVYDSQLQQVSSFLNRDPLLDAVRVASFRSLAVSRGQLFSADPLSLRLRSYGPGGQLRHSVTLPGRSFPAATAGQAAPRGPVERRQFARSLHRFDWVFGFEHGVLFREVHQERQISNWLIWSEERRTIYRYEGLHLLVGEGVKDYLTFDALAGAYPSGVIAVLADEERAHRFPMVEAMRRFRGTDNPLLCFLKPKIPS